MITREFDRDDWNGFAGCERFENGHQPLIGETTDGAVVVFDAQGGCALFGDEHDDFGGYALERTFVHQADAEAVARKIETKQDLLTLGFQPL